jgi:heme/copper-type cytochrome/quinol oxidase subunit 3
VKQCQVSTTRHVIEGAKLIGAGAATIALAGAAVGIGKEKRAVYALVATVLLALVFTGFQGMEYYEGRGRLR